MSCLHIGRGDSREYRHNARRAAIVRRHRLWLEQELKRLVEDGEREEQEL